MGEAHHNPISGAYRGTALSGRVFLGYGREHCRICEQHKPLVPVTFVRYAKAVVEIEVCDGLHGINEKGTLEFLEKHLRHRIRD